MKLAQERLADLQTTRILSKQKNKQPNQQNQNNQLATHTNPAFRVPLLASLVFVVSIVGCAKNNPPASNPSSAQSQQPAQSETPKKPQTPPSPNLQEEGPFMEPVCRPPEPDEQTPNQQTPSEQKPNQRTPNQQKQNPKK